MDSASIACAALIAFALYCAVHVFSSRGRNSGRLPYPPGPRPTFLVGNLFDMPQSHPSQVFAEWGRKYNSDILFASAFGKHLVILNSVKAADDLIGRKGELYNDRPTIPTTSMMGWNWNMALMEYHRGWRSHRRATHEWFSKTAIQRYQPVQYHTVHTFLQNMLEDPENYREHSKTFGAAVILRMMYGYEPDGTQDPLVNAAEESATLAFSLILIGSTVIHLMPFLRHIPPWFPFADKQKLAARCRTVTKDMQRLPLEFLKKSMMDGSATPSILGDFYERQATTGASDHEETILKNISWTAYGAASDTTATPIVVFIYLMAKHPEIQRRAQAELDRVVGDERLPVFNDRPVMPYIEAIYKELLRYHPPAVLGVPHASTEDDIHDGYFIPKGSTVYTNLWAMSHDEKIFPEPGLFKPERFLDEAGKVIEGRMPAFGFGTRICPGRFIASGNLWLLIASFLACFNVNRAVDESGNEVELNEEWIDWGAVVHKKPVTCKIVPRTRQKVDLINAHAEQAK